MRILVDAATAKETDRVTIEEIGIPSAVLMERAALALADAVCTHVEPGESALFLCGTGNNGADGLAAARILSERKISSEVIICGNPEKATGEWKMQKSILEALNLPVQMYTEKTAFPAAAVYVDALFGIGLNREPSGIYARAIDSFMYGASKCQAYVIAADIPSGVNASDGNIAGISVHANETVTFGFEKTGQFLYPGTQACGKVSRVDIGLVSRPHFVSSLSGVYLLEENDLDSFLPAREPSGNKGTFGTVLVVAGASGMAGAAIFAASAAYRSGAGLVKILTAPENQPIMQMQIPEAVLITKTENESLAETVKRALNRVSSVIVGPGLSTSDSAFGLLQEVLCQAKDIPVVIDADGLNLLSAHPVPLPEKTVLTPHVGELARLLHTDVKEIRRKGLLASARSLRDETGAVCVCKDARTVIADSMGLMLNDRGSDGMAVGGSGDVLAGLIGGLLAQNGSPEFAARAGVLIHALAGERASSILGRAGMLATDLLASIPMIIKIFQDADLTASGGILKHEKL